MCCAYLACISCTCYVNIYVIRTFIWRGKTLPGTNLLKFKNITKALTYFFLTKICYRIPKKLSKSFTIANVHLKENLWIQKLSWPMPLLKPTKFQIKTQVFAKKSLLNQSTYSLVRFYLLVTIFFFIWQEESYFRQLLLFSWSSKRFKNRSAHTHKACQKLQMLGYTPCPICCCSCCCCCRLKHVFITFYSVIYLPILFDNDHKKRCNLVVISLVPLGLLVGNKSINGVFTFTPKFIIK